MDVGIRKIKDIIRDIKEKRVKEKEKKGKGGRESRRKKEER